MAGSAPCWREPRAALGTQRVQEEKGWEWRCDRRDGAAVAELRGLRLPQLWHSASAESQGLANRFGFPRRGS